jgi:hypothetical protein
MECMRILKAAIVVLGDAASPPAQHGRAGECLGVDELQMSSPEVSNVEKMHDGAASLGYVDWQGVRLSQVEPSGRLTLIILDIFHTSEQFAPPCYLNLFE